MSRRLNFLLLLLIGLVSGLFAIPAQPVQAATIPKRVMLVYDSRNDVANDKENIDTLQRSLTSMNLQVKTVEQSDYESGMLTNKFAGVITMINWRQVGLINQHFITDRDKFQGIKLHIGEDLTDNETNELGVKVQKIYQQQLILKDEDNEELLPFKNSIIVITQTAEKTQSIGTLTTQQTDSKTYPYGYINGKYGYLPFFSKSGLSQMVAVKMIGKLFNQTGNYQPLLTFTKVTPYSNLRRLDELSKFCYQNEIPFAVSIVSVSENTEMKAFDRYTAVLRNIENRGGVIFLQAPEISSNADSNGQILEQNFMTYIVSLARHQVYPVGISANGFWNQDKVLRHNSLRFASHWILLPDGEKVTYVKQDNDSKTAQQSYFAMPASSLNDVKKDSLTSFPIPTALTIDLPYSKKSLNLVESTIKNLNLSWFDPVNDDLRTEINTDTTHLEYQHGSYFANGQEEEIKSSNTDLTRQFSDGAPTSLFSNFFKVQGNILAVFFVIVMIILLTFIYIGQRVYWNRFRR